MWLRKAIRRYRGYKIVAFDGQRYYSVYDKSTINVDEMTSEFSGKGLFLGTSPEFCIDYYSGLTDDQDILLTYEYTENDLINGDPLSDNGEVQVRRATLVSMNPV